MEGNLKHAYDSIHFFFNLVIPETDYFITLRFQISGSFFIIFGLFQVLTTIQLDDEFLFDRDEVNNACTEPVEV